MTARANFSVIKGDTFNRTCTFRNKASGTPVSLVGAIVSGGVKPSAGGDSVPLVCTVLNGESGQFRFGLPASSTASLRTGINFIEVQVVYVDGTVQTLISGNLVVQDQKDV